VFGRICSLPRPIPAPKRFRRARFCALGIFARMKLTTRSLAGRGWGLTLLIATSCNRTPVSEDIRPDITLPGPVGMTASGGSGPSPASGGAAGAAMPAPDAAADEVSAPVAASCGVGQTCYDFEGGTVGQPPGAPWTGRGTIDDGRSFAGKRALHVTAGNDNAFATLAAPFFPVANNEYYGRVMAFTDDVPGAHWTFIRSRGRSADKGFMAEYTYGGDGHTIIANYDTPDGPASDCWKNGGSFPVGKWVCMEWHFKGATNELELWVDGTADQAHVVGQGDGCMGNGTGAVWYAPVFRNLQLGYAVYGTPGDRSVWFDDLALSASGRIGCPAPR
jgi:hypothetical protein